ncbi:chloride channel protein [Bacteriovorax sp. PP10]|uniref:Chloride channel protein n=1 Tax=Bacteriovorax antarcticus TaxID=3088717 RepID=A0ABU5VQJ6_9BACT|nr:chloride channel protein [Bacteriovorax sp. PP10]MEA9355314.1 chloride channel protein [Bacteriovorax sp. PP10]
MNVPVEFKRRRMIILCLLAALIGVIATVIAKVLLLAIAFCTNLFWFHTISIHPVELVNHHFSPIYILVPVLGGLVVGLMARYGSSAIRGHGIPEVMENILTKESRIPRRITFLKPLSAAIAIGSGGPFGAEGPIIATGSSVGSWIGRHFYFHEYERKILLAVGAAAGMTAIFGTPLAAVFICIELLLFEFSAKSFIPVIIGVSTAYSIRLATGHTAPEFPIGEVAEAVNGWNTLFYIVAGAISGAVACVVSKIVFWVEDKFEHLPIHWMWWPMIGGVAVGVIGYYDPRTLGVGYSNIINALQGNILLWPALTLLIFKFISWAIALGSGTSGGTLAPLLTFGSSLGVVLSFIGIHFFPDIGITIQVTALVCMSSMFSGATRAVLTSTVFALEVTGAHFGIAPLLLGNSAAFLFSIFFLKETIMTEKIARRGIFVPQDYYSIRGK